MLFENLACCHVIISGCRDVISGPQPRSHARPRSVLVSLTRRAMHHASARPQKYPPGQACHVGQIRLSDWLKFEMLRSDWLGPKPTPCTTCDHERIIQDAELNKSVALETVLSQGRYATVWKGRVMREPVAVKIFPITAISAWQKERNIYELLSVGHSNITKLITLREARDNDPIWFIMEYCENGSLTEYLENKVLSWSEAVVLASGISSAVAFLHSESFQAGGIKVAIAHRDLKSTNVLVRKDGTSVISDFGLAVLLNSVEDESRNVS